MLAGTLKGIVAQNLLKKKGGGRVAALEVLIVNAAVSSLIREAKNNQIMSIMQTAKKEGMTLLNDELAKFVKQDIVEADEAWKKAVDKDGFLKALESVGVTSFKPPAE
jgi:twitching motility protein PilT